MLHPSAMKAPSMALLRTFSPFWRPTNTASQVVAPTCLGLLSQTQTAQFSATPARQKRNRRVKREPRITQIRYFLDHPVTPRPLRFSRNRALRHWTIHRAWRLYQTKQHTEKQRTLERQFESMNLANETLRHLDSLGLTSAERDKLGEPEREGEEKDRGRLYRLAMLKQNIWQGIPIEYARIQTETPGREPWNHSWRR